MAEKDNLEPFKKAFLIGLGATVLTVEKIQEFANDMVERGELTQKDAKNFAEDLQHRAVQEKEQFESKMKSMMDGYMKTAAKGLGFVTREEYDALCKDIESLKKKASSKSSTDTDTDS